MTDKVQKILSEIATRKLCTMDEHMAFYNDKAKEDYELLSEIEEFIKALQEEPVSEEIEVSYDAKINEAHRLGREEGMFLAKTMFKEPVIEDLEKAAKHYLYSNILYDDVYVGEPTDKDCIEMFKAGANWQKKQDQETIELAEDHAMLAGMNKMEQQMMAKAIDAKCFGFQGDALFSFKLPADKYLVGSKVKVIVIKK